MKKWLFSLLGLMALTGCISAKQGCNDAMPLETGQSARTCYGIVPADDAGGTGAAFGFMLLKDKDGKYKAEAASAAGVTSTGTIATDFVPSGVGGVVGGLVGRR